ncbi:MAG: hypothetical protein SGI77_28410 [Pirellulaceae bacterium]|nr:hypothetical protein [Pirellulaceae bacterium]
MSERIALRCQVDRLAPHEGANELVLGLIWHVAWAEDFDAADDQDLLWVEPWCWQDAISQVRLCFRKNGINDSTTDLTVAAIPADLTLAERTALHAPLHVRVVDLRSKVGAASFTIDLHNPDVLPPEEGHVTQLQSNTQRTVGMLGYWLRLSAVVKVPLALFPSGMWDAGNNRLAANSELFALPHLRIRSIAGILPAFTSDATYVPNSTGPDAAGIWHYDRTVGSGPALDGVVLSIDSDVADPDGRYIELQSGWVRSQLSAGGSTVDPPDPNVHWPTVVNDRVSESWDLARHLFDAVRNCVSIPTFDVYWNMIVAALRDRAGLGLIDTPDGEGLLRYVLQLAVPTLEPATTVESLVRQGSLSSLRAKLRVDEPITTGPDANDTKLKQWYAVLRGLFPVLNTDPVEAFWPKSPAVDQAFDETNPPISFDVSWFLTADTSQAPVKTAENVPGRWRRVAQEGAYFEFESFGLAPAPAVPARYVQALVRAHCGIVASRPRPISTYAPRPSRPVALTWPPGDLGVAHVLGSGDPQFDVFYFDGTTKTKMNAGLVPGRRSATDDGGASFTFDAYDAVFDKPLSAGRYVAVTNDGTADRESAMSLVHAGVSDDLGSLVRLHTDLKRDENLIRLIRPVWAAHATRFLGVAAGDTSPAWYVSVFADVSEIPSTPVTAKTLGEIRPLDGRVWVLTVAELSYGRGNDVGCITELEFGTEYDLNGSPVAGSAGLVLCAEWKAGPAVELTWLETNFLSAPTPILPVTLVPPTAVTAGEKVHLRVEYSRDTSAPLHFSAQAFLGTGNRGSIIWRDGPQIIVNAANLTRLGLRVRNAAPPDITLPAGAALSAASPTLLTATKSLADSSPEITLLRNTWYKDFDPGLRLWNEGLKPVSSTEPNVAPIDRVLSQIDVRELLTLGQIARFFPVWNKEWNLAHPDFLANIKIKFEELVKASVRQRFDHADHLKSSIYRDFEPRFDGKALNADVWKLIDEHLTLVARAALPGKREVDATGYTEHSKDSIPVPKSPPLQFQVDRPGTFADSNGAVDLDLLRKISGFGVLLRQAPKSRPSGATRPDDWFLDQPWRLLNCVDVGVLVENPPAPGNVEDPYEPYPVPDSLKLQPAPVPLQYQDNVRQTMISYENRHLMASSPLTEIADVYGFGNAKPDELAPLLRRVPGAPTGHDWGLLPALKYGQWYQALPFVIGNGGALPKALADGHPARLRVDSPPDADLPIHSPASDSDGDGIHDRPDYIRRIVHLRSVGVGAPRAFALTKDGLPSLDLKKPPLPSSPREVIPLARDWNIRGLTHTERSLREFYDAGLHRNELPIADAANWMLVIPRVAVCGAADTDTGDANQHAVAEFDLWAGLTNTNDESNLSGSCGLGIQRDKEQLTVTHGGTTSNITLTSPAGGPLESGSIDLRLALADGNFYLAWRRSDRDEPWADGTQSGQLLGPATAPTAACRLLIRRQDAALVRTATTPSVSGESTITLGGPRFATGNVVIRNDRPVDDDLALRDLAAHDRQVTVVAPPPIADDSAAGLTTATEVLNKWSGPNPFARIAIRPPAIDLATWTSWFDMDLHLGKPETSTEIRERVWKYHTLTEGNNHQPGNEKKDATIDDRAVDLLVLELVPLRTARKQEVMRISWDPQDNDDSANLMREVQRKLRQLDIKVTSKVDGFAARVALAKAGSPVTPEILRDKLNETRLVGSGNDPLTVLFEEQEIWEIRIYPAIREKYFTKTTDESQMQPGSQRFHSAFLERLLIQHDGPGTEFDDDYRLGPAWKAVIEVATREVVLPEVIVPLDISSLPKIPDFDPQLTVARKTLLDSIIPRFDGSRIAVRLQKPAPWCFRYVSEVRLLRQVWRWRGRPVPPFPADAAAPALIDAFPPDADGPYLTQSERHAPDLPQLWDAIGFGDRSTTDLLDQTTGIAAANASATLYTENLAGDRRALYFRFGAQATGRYAALFPGERLECQASETAKWQDSKKQEVTVANAWRRLFVPTRRDEELPRPAVRFVVPLTESEDDSRPVTTPGLLVVLDDAWFSYGGLAEALEAEISMASDYYRDEPALEPVVFRPEFGPDPTLTNRGWTKVDVGEAAEGAPDELEAPSKALSMQIVGPIGHTFDTGAEAPLFNATSFILRPPGVDAVDGQGTAAGESDPWYGDSLAWYFAKVRFRRVLLPEATADYRTGPQITISAEQPFDFVLAKDRGWVVDLPRILITRAAGTVVNFKIKLESSSLFGVVRIRQSGDRLDLSSGPADDADLPNEALLIKAANWHEVELDLRVVHVLDTKTEPEVPEPEVPGDTSRKPQPRHSSVQYRIRAVRNEATTGPVGERMEPASPGRVWHLLERRNWASDDDHAWPEHWKLSATGNVQCATPQALPARMSSYTDPQWVQFLPDSLLLRRLVTDDDARMGRPWDFSLEWKGDDDDPLKAKLRRRFGDDGEWTYVTDRLSKHERKAFGDITFRRFALLTEMISDVRGQLGQERYLGLFKFTDATNAVDCSLDVTHQFPDVRPKEIRKMRRLRIRIIEFQFVHADEAVSEDSLKFGPWSHLFAEQPEPQTKDATARVVSVSPPIELQQEN